MKTTLVLKDVIWNRLRLEAARQGRTMSEIVEDALRHFFQRRRVRSPESKLPQFDGGPFLVDISDRDALYRSMEEEN